LAILEVLTFPNPILRKKGEPVREVNDEIRKLADDMLETMYAERGIGLAAPQVGVSLRLFVMDTRPKNAETDRYDLANMTELEKKVMETYGSPLVLINPEIIAKKGKQTYEEGCLSIPTYFETVERYNWIKVRALDRNGKTIEFEVDGLMSVCIQHENDHLDGKLFVDRLSTIKSQRIVAKIRKFGYPKPDEEEKTATEKELAKI
jgi:peptide deformylase